GHPGSNSTAPVVIKAKIFRREVSRVHIDSGSSCEVIYEHCFTKIRPSKIDLKVPLIGFSREESWSIWEIPLEITIGDAPLVRKETLNFVIVKSNSPYNMLLGRIAMQKIGIVVSTIHNAIKFHIAKGVGSVFLTYESDEVKEGMKKYPEQTITIRRHLPEHFKGRLRDLLKANADVFAWTHADMTGISRTIMIEGKPFNTEHKLSEYSHVKPIKQKRRGMGPYQNTAACKEVEEQTKAGILRKNAGATYQILVEKVFHDQIERNLEAYVNDMVIKRRIAMQKIGIVVSTIHKAIKFHTAKGVGSVFLTYESDETDILERFKNLQDDYDMLIETHAECSETVQKLVTARVNLEHNAKLYNDKTNRYKMVKEDHDGCDNRLQVLEK
nr:hypothetical protein [Tanacetum cinerariifolium]